MTRLLVLALLLVGCASSKAAPGAPSPSAEHSTYTLPPTIVSAALVDGRLVAHLDERAPDEAAAAPSGSGAPRVVLDGSAILVPVGEGASTQLYGLWAALDGQLVRIDAPEGEPGPGQPWQIAVGAGAVSSSGLRCSGAHRLDVLRSDGATVTVESYELRDGVVTAVAEGPSPPPADQVGSLDC